MGRKKKRDTDVYDIVASNIKKFRIAAGITQEQLADKTLYAPEYIRRIESPKRKGGFSIEVVYGISKALGIGMEEFFKNKKRIKFLKILFHHPSGMVLICANI